MKVHRSVALVVTIAVVGGLGAFILRGTQSPHVLAANADFSVSGMPTDRAPEKYMGSFLDGSTAAMLSRLNVSVHPEDKVYAFPDPSLHVGSTILVYRASEVTLTDAKKTTTVHTWAKTVEEFAEEQNLDLAEKDKTSVPLDEAIPVQEEPIAIAVTRVAETSLALTSVVPFTTQYKDDATLEKGTNVTEQAGKNGSLRKTYLVRREDGVEVSRTLQKTEQTADPVTQIIRRGTKIVLLDSGGASFYRACGTGRMTAAHKTLPKGTQVKVVNVANGKSVIVTIDDRGPYITGRVIDLSCDAFAVLASVSQGVISSVRVEKP